MGPRGPASWKVPTILGGPQDVVWHKGRWELGDDDGTGGHRPGWVSSQGGHSRGTVPITVASGLWVRPTPTSAKVSSHPLPGAGESGKSTIVKQMK